ncbi:MAG: DUF2341 domain-containing protein, partial [Candidatus Bathyarchaeia archaeon]
MNRIILFSVLTITLLFSVTTSTFIESTNASPVWYDENWQYRQKLTINQTKVTCDLTNFPILVFLDNINLTKAQNDGDDILFTDSTQQKLNHEIEFFSNATGTLYAWVRIPNLDSDSATVIYIYYGNNAASDQRNPAGVWDSNYKMVQHLNEDISPHLDSTSNDNHGDPIGGINKSATGIIDGADDFDGVSGYVDFGSNASLAITSKITFEAWIYP